MEGGGQLREVAVDEAGVVVAGGQTHDVAVAGDLLDERQLRGVGEKGEVHFVGARHGVAVGGQILQQRADAGVGVLHIVHGVFTVLPHGQTQIELHLRFRLGVEEVAAGVHGHHVQQIRQGHGLARALGHAHHLAVLHQLHQLHEHDVQPMRAVQPQSVHGAFEAGDVAVVVGAPDIDDLVEAADGKFIAVVGDVGGEIGVKPVGAAEHVVLQPQLLDGLVGLAGGLELSGENFGGLQPQGAVLFVGVAPLGQLRHGVGHIAALMEAGLEEPLIVLNAVPRQIGLHLGDVMSQTELRQRVVAGLFVRVQEAIAVGVGVELRQLADVVAVVAVLGELHGVLTLENLEIAGFQTLGKFFDLIAGVIDIELPPYVGAGLLEHGGQGVAQHAAAGVAHVHGAGGVGGNELHHVLFAPQGVVFTVGFARLLHGAHGLAEPARAQGEVQEPRAGHGGGGEVAAGKLHVVQQELRQLTGVLLQRLGSGQTDGGGVVAVGGVLGDLHRGLHGAAGGQKAGVGSLVIGLQGQLQHLRLGVLNHIHSNSLLTFSLETRSAKNSQSLPPAGGKFFRRLFI